ncbi:MAG: hypothetical protein WBQ03_17070 [Candidatus Sulfotelmatobacter sp.]
MPVIMAEAGIVGLTPDPSSSTRFTWLVKIHFQCSDCGNGLDKEITDEFELTSVGGKCAIAFPHVRGGDLTITVSADLETGYYEKISKGLKIRGVNPAQQEINAACGVVALQKICCQESGRRQFDAVAETGVADCPLFSGDGLGGVGSLIPRRRTTITGIGGRTSAMARKFSTASEPQPDNIRRQCVAR